MWFTLDSRLECSSSDAFITTIDSLCSLHFIWVHIKNSILDIVYPLQSILNNLCSTVYTVYTKQSIQYILNYLYSTVYSVCTQQSIQSLLNSQCSLYSTIYSTVYSVYTQQSIQYILNSLYPTVYTVYTQVYTL